MHLAIFDLDNTLLSGDSDYLWCRFLMAQGIIDAAEYEAANERFLAEYRAGTLDIDAFLRFVLAPLAHIEPERLAKLQQEFLETRIRPIIPETARSLLQEHRERGDQLLIITATNRIVTGPIAADLGVTDLLATEVEIVDGWVTGCPTGIPCFQHGKVKRLEAWLADHPNDYAATWFYSDSHNDLPLLEQVNYPVAVDPDPQLRRIAIERDWPILYLHGLDDQP